MLKINKIHHIAIICSNYIVSKKFYTDVLGFEIMSEVYRKERDSYMLELALNNQYVIELFSFPEPPTRISRPEAAGLRHLAFEVDDIENTVLFLEKNNVECEAIRIDPFTKKKYTFFNDPDMLPLELYEK